MGKTLFWKVLLSLMLAGKVYAAADLSVGTLSDGACWYQNLDPIRVASFNDKTSYSGSRAQIESELEALIGKHEKINEMDLSLHCGGYGASLVAKVTTENNMYCVWAKFDSGKLSLRSLGALSGEGKNPNDLCEGHIWGEFIMGANSEDFIAELQSAKWSSMIKSVTIISNKVYKVTLVKEYEFRELEVIDQIQENFTGKNFIRFIEFNDYHHPIGEFVHLR